MLKSLLGIARQWNSEKFAISSLQPRSCVRVLIYRTWAISFLSLWPANKPTENFHVKSHWPYLCTSVDFFSHASYFFFFKRKTKLAADHVHNNTQQSPKIPLNGYSTITSPRGGLYFTGGSLRVSSPFYTFACYSDLAWLLATPPNEELARRFRELISNIGPRKSP